MPSSLKKADNPLLLQYNNGIFKNLSPRFLHDDAVTRLHVFLY